LTGTLGGALEARGIPAGEDNLWSDVTGEVEKEDGVLVIKRIHVRYHLKLAADKRAAAERAHTHHADRCPVARSVKGCIEVRTELAMEDL
jgi:organic hydroperoxide reductase OsmC/OhrA